MTRVVVRLLAAVAILLGAATAIALPAKRPDDSPRPVLAKTTAPLAHSNSRDGRAVLTAANLKPGDHRTGEVTITNEGHEGALYLVAHHPTDRRAPLSERVELTIADGRNVIARGAVSAGCHPLGTFDEGESRTYTFAVALPATTGNAYAGASTTVDYEWLNACPGDPLPPPSPADDRRVTAGDTRLAIEPGPYRFSRGRGTARVGIRCLSAASGSCTGRLELERWKARQGKGIAMAVGRFDIDAGHRRTIVLTLNDRARRRITSTGLVDVRAYVMARSANGRHYRVAYRDRLLYGRR
jgi:hypothetical protein